MKLLPYAILAALLLSIASCRRDNAALERMHHAEAIMHTSPDSALAIIRSIPDSTLHSAEARALHALLLTQALDKNYIDLQLDSTQFSLLTSSSVILDNQHRMKAHFYLGRVNVYKKDYAEALINFTITANEAQELCDTFFLAMAYQETGELYSYIYDGPQQIEYTKRSYDLFKKSSQYQEYVPWAKITYARALHNNLHDEECLVLANEIISDNKLSIQDSSVYSEALFMKSLALFSLGEYSASIPVFEESMRLSADAFTITEAYNLCKAYAYTDNLAMAESIATQYLKSDEAWGVPSIYYQKMGDIERANVALTNEFNISSMIIKTSMYNNVNQIARKLQEDAAEEYRSRDHKKSIIIVLIVSFTILLGIIIALYILKTREHNRRKLYEIQIYTDSLLKTIKTLQSSGKERKATDTLTAEVLQSAFGMSFENIISITKEYFNLKNLPDGNKRISKLIEKSLKSFIGDNAVKKLAALIDKCLGNLATDFKEKFPNFSQSDYTLFVYLVCGFSITPIAVFMDSSVSAISSRKSRLKSKISASDCSNKTRFLRYFQ